MCDTWQYFFSVPQLIYLSFLCRIHLTFMDHLGAMKMSTSSVSMPATDLVTPLEAVLMLRPGSSHSGHAPAHLAAGKALKGDASAYQMATKFGIVYTPTEFGVNGKKEYVRTCVEGSLKRLGVECIDLYYQVGSWHPHAGSYLMSSERPLQPALGAHWKSTSCTEGSAWARQPHVNSCPMPPRAAVQNPQLLSAFLLAAAAYVGQLSTL